MGECYWYFYNTGENMKTSSFHRGNWRESSVTVPTHDLGQGRTLIRHVLPVTWLEEGLQLRTLCLIDGDQNCLPRLDLTISNAEESKQSRLWPGLICGQLYCDLKSKVAGPRGGGTLSDKPTSWVQAVETFRKIHRADNLVRKSSPHLAFARSSQRPTAYTYRRNI